MPYLPTSHSLPPALPRPRLAHPALGFHLLGVEPAQVGRAQGVARLGVALLAAESVLLVLLLAFGVGSAPAGARAVGRPVVRFVVPGEFLVDGYVEEVGFGGAYIAAGFLSLWWRAAQLA